MERAHALDGVSIGALARQLSIQIASRSSAAKGRAGEILEQALGASAGNQDQPDFPGLGVELKTVPLDRAGRVRESTYVCYLDLQRIQQEEWESSRVRRKLRRVLWFPIQWLPGEPPARRRLGSPLLWSPDPEEETLIRGDYNHLVGCIAVGGIEELTAHRGQVLQIRPKAANAASRVEAPGPEGEPLPTVPRGFYLRARFTEQILWSG